LTTFKKTMKLLPITTTNIASEIMYDNTGMYYYASSENGITTIHIRGNGKPIDIPSEWIIVEKIFRDNGVIPLKDKVCFYFKQNSTEIINKHKSIKQTIKPVEPSGPLFHIFRGQIDGRVCYTKPRIYFHGSITIGNLLENEYYLTEPDPPAVPKQPTAKLVLRSLSDKRFNAKLDQMAQLLRTLSVHEIDIIDFALNNNKLHLVIMEDFMKVFYELYGIIITSNSMNFNITRYSAIINNIITRICNYITCKPISPHNYNIYPGTFLMGPEPHNCNTYSVAPLFV